MWKVVLIIVGHLVAIAILLFAGIRFNDLLGKWAGVTTVLSLAFGAYSIAASVLYHKNRRFHLFVNRARMLLVRTHTYWRPAFRFSLGDEWQGTRSTLLTQLRDAIKTGRHGTMKIVEELPNRLVLCFDDLFTVVFRLDDEALFFGVDQKLLVPSHLYERWAQRFERLAEDVRTVVAPTEVQCSLLVTFEAGHRNPYFGFFINHIPSNLLQRFQVVFRVDVNSQSRIEASADSINIEGTSLADLFHDAREVLALRALPSGADA
jgi:hypothetical protein